MVSAHVHGSEIGTFSLSKCFTSTCNVLQVQNIINTSTYALLSPASTKTTEFIHSPIHSCIRPFVHFVDSVVNSFIHHLIFRSYHVFSLFVYLFIHLFTVYWLVYPFLYLLTIAIFVPITTTTLSSLCFLCDLKRRSTQDKFHYYRHTVINYSKIQCR